MRSAECGIEIIRTTFGWVGAAVSEKGIRAVILPKKTKEAVLCELRRTECSNAPGARYSEGLLSKAMKQMERYFAGQAVSFDLPLDLHGSTPFQLAVWQAAADIPYGETRSYGWIASRIRKPKAARAVGQAMGANPVPLLVP